MFHEWTWGWGFFPCLIIGLVIWLISKSSDRRDHYNLPHDSDTSLDILKRRYAKGEITKEQFDQMKKDIE